MPEQRNETRARLLIVLAAMILICGSVMVKSPDEAPAMVATRGDEIIPGPLPTIPPEEVCTKIPPCSCPGRACIRIGGGGSWER